MTRTSTSRTSWSDCPRSGPARSQSCFPTAGHPQAEPDYPCSRMGQHVLAGRLRSSDLACTSNQEVDFAHAAAQHGFTSALIAPAPSPVGLSRVGVLCLGSSDPNQFDGDSFPRVRVLARALSMELHHWVEQSMREELLQGVRLTEADLSLLRHEASGHSSKFIGAAMNLEAKTIDCRFQRRNSKLGAPDRRTAVRIGRLYGLL